MPGSEPRARQRRGVDHLAGAEGRGARPQRGGRDGGHAPERDGLRRRGGGRRGRPPGGRRARAAPGRRARASGWRGAGRHEVGPTGDHAGLGPAEQLVAAEGHERGAVGEVWRAAGSPASHAGGPSGSHGQAASSSPEPMSTTTGGRRAPREQLRRHGLGEALDAVVRGVHLQHAARRRRPAIGRRLVVGEAGAVGGADVDEPGAGLLAAPRARGTRRRSPRSRPGSRPRSRPAASAAMTSSTAAALLFTTIAASAPHSLASSRPTWSCREPRWPVSRSSSRFAVAGRLPVAEGRPPEVGVEQDAGGVDERAQQRPAGARRPARGPTPGRPPAIAARATSTSSGWGRPVSTSERARASTEGGRITDDSPSDRLADRLGDRSGDFAVAGDREVAQRSVAVTLRRRWVSESGRERRNDARRSGPPGSGTASGRR